MYKCLHLCCFLRVLANSVKIMKHEETNPKNDQYDNELIFVFKKSEKELKSTLEKK